jgi:hypothetical protein
LASRGRWLVLGAKAARLATFLADQANGFDRDAALDGFQHVVDRQGSNRGTAVSASISTPVVPVTRTVARIRMMHSASSGSHSTVTAEIGRG